MIIDYTAVIDIVTSIIEIIIIGVLMGILEILYKILGVITPLITGLGLWFIWKQIKIAKNKDIVLIIQKSLENEMNEYIKHDFAILDALESFVKDIFYDPDHDNKIGERNYRAWVNYKDSDKDDDFQCKYKKFIKNHITYIPNELFSLYYWALSDEETEELIKIRTRISEADIIHKLNNLESLENAINDNVISRVEFERIFYNQSQYRTKILMDESKNLTDFISTIAKKRGIL